MTTNADQRRSAPAVARNREPLLEALNPYWPEAGTVLEIAAGTGEHAVFMARALPHLTFQPSDPDPDALVSINAWRQAEALPNVKPALALDAAVWPWSAEAAAMVLCINMIHIAPWSATEGLMRGAGALLPPGGVLATYGPYRVDGKHTAPSNEAFEGWLKNRDPAFGVRDMALVAEAAVVHGLVLTAKIPMPANNFTLIFKRQEA